MMIPTVTPEHAMVHALKKPQRCSWVCGWVSLLDVLQRRPWLTGADPMSVSMECPIDYAIGCSLMCFRGFIHG